MGEIENKMSLTDFKPQFDNAYEEVFQKVLVGKEICNTRFKATLSYGESVEKSPGVWVDEIVEYSYYGDVIRNTRALDTQNSVNGDVSVGNSISVVADEYAFANFAKFSGKTGLGRDEYEILRARRKLCCRNPQSFP